MFLPNRGLRNPVYVPGRESGKGFTLIELLITIAIILILIAIALPNFLEARVRSQVVHAAAEMKSIAEAQMMRFNDHGSFTDDFMHFQDADNNSLTTPIPYLTEYPVDPFQKFRNQTIDFPHYRIGTGNIKVSRANGFPLEGCSNIRFPGCGPENERHPEVADTFIIVSKGPDDLDNGGAIPFYPHPNPAGAASYRPYSPTNGTYSEGDMFRFGGSVPQAYRFLVGQ